MRNLTYTLSPHPPRSLRSLTPSKKGVKRALTDLVRLGIFNPTPEALLMVDLHIFVLSGSTEEPDNTNGSKSNHQHKEVSGVRLKCAT